MNSRARLFFKFSQHLDWIARWIIVAIMVLVVSNVILRLFGVPIKGTYEWVGFLTACAIGLSLAYCAFQEGHIAVTFAVERLSPKLQLFINIFANILSLLFVFLAMWEIGVYASSMLNNEQVALTTKVPLYPFIYILALGFLGYCLVLVGKIVESFRKVDNK